MASQDRRATPEPLAEPHSSADAPPLHCEMCDGPATQADFIAMARMRICRPCLERSAETQTCQSP